MLQVKHMVALAVAFSMFACDGEHSANRPPVVAGSVPHGALDRISMHTGLSFPDASTVTHFVEADTLGDGVWAARVVVPTQAAMALRNVIEAKPVARIQYTPAIAGSAPWWQPGNKVLTTQYSADPYTFVYIVVADEAEGCAVYLECAVH